MKLFSEKINSYPLMVNFSTVANTSRHKIKVEAGEKVGILCEYGGCTAVGTTFLSAAATGAVQFFVLEATAASAAGSAISGATMSLGPSTMNEVTGGCQLGIIQVTSDLTTEHEFTINGCTFHASVAGPGRDGSDVAATVAYYINNHATLGRLVEAHANVCGTGIVEVWPKPQCTGISMSLGDASAVMGARHYAGMIELSPAEMSTNQPKYIGVGMTTHAGATGVRSAKLLKSGPFSPSFCGKVVKI